MTFMLWLSVVLGAMCFVMLCLCVAHRVWLGAVANLVGLGAAFLAYLSASDALVRGAA